MQHSFPLTPLIGNRHPSPHLHLLLNPVVSLKPYLSAGSQTSMVQTALLLPALLLLSRLAPDAAAARLPGQAPLRAGKGSSVEAAEERETRAGDMHSNKKRCRPAPTNQCCCHRHAAAAAVPSVPTVAAPLPQLQAASGMSLSWEAALRA